MTPFDRACRICLSLAGIGLLASCASPGPAPVESRAVPGSLPAEQRSATGKPLGSLEPVGKGQYRVRRGDTLYSIAVDHNADWKDLARWNTLSNPNLIEPGQVLWVMNPSPRSGPALAQSSPPAAAGAQARPIAPGSGVGVRPLQSQPPANRSLQKAQVWAPRPWPSLPRRTLHRPILLRLQPRPPNSPQLHPLQRAGYGQPMGRLFRAFPRGKQGAVDCRSAW